MKVSINFRGIDLSDAFVCIDQIFGNDRNGWNASVGIYANEEARKNGLMALEMQNIQVAYIAGEDPVAQVNAEIQKRFAETK